MATREKSSAKAAARKTTATSSKKKTASKTTTKKSSSAKASRSTTAKAAKAPAGAATRKSAAPVSQKSSTTTSKKTAKKATQKTAQKATGKATGKATTQPAGKSAGKSASGATGKSSTSSRLRGHAAEVIATGDRVREGIRDMAVAAMDGATASTNAIQDVVSEVMHGASSAMRDAMPKSAKSPLRDVIGGLTEAASVVGETGRKSASHGAKTAKKAVEGGSAMRDTALRSTQDVLSAVEKFASNLSGSVRKEIEHLVAEARTTGGRLEAPARKAADAVAKHPAKLVKESAETGVRMALGTTSRLMNAAGGMLTGFGGSLARAAGGDAGPSRSERRSGGNSGKGGKRSSVKGHKPAGGAGRPAAPRSRKT